MMPFKGDCRERKERGKELAPPLFKVWKWRRSMMSQGCGYGGGVWLWSRDLLDRVLALFPALGGHSRTLTL